MFYFNSVLLPWIKTNYFKVVVTIALIFVVWMSISHANKHRSLAISIFGVGDMKESEAILQRLTLLELDSKRFQSLLDHNVEELRNLFTEDYIHIHSTGMREGRETYLELLHSNLLKYSTLDSYDVDVLPLSIDCSIVTGKVKIVANLNGTEVNPHVRYSNTYCHSRLKKRWLNRMWQATPLHE